MPPKAAVSKVASPHPPVFHSPLAPDSEPTDEQLAQIMREMMVDVRARARLARQKIQQDILRETEAVFKRYGIPFRAPPLE